MYSYTLILPDFKEAKCPRTHTGEEGKGRRKERGLRRGENVSTWAENEAVACEPWSWMVDYNTPTTKQEK